MQDDWASEKFVRPSIEESALLNAGKIGMVQAYAEMIALNYEAFTGDMEDGEYLGPGAQGSGGTGGDLRAGDED